ncbi:MAG: methyltransferase domain-containing protein [Myxococcales bacterium]|nr:methyltransferase domain-containing protein [Myxococcales bacterium]MCB9737408.1 methyltransferase domain-containing protein [Deltaproteobacteria bacterium]
MTDLFADKAADYDARDVPQRLSAAFGARLAEDIALDAGMEVLDFGAGTGLVTGHVVGRVRRVTAVDVSPAMLAKLAAKHGDRADLEILCHDILEAPLERRFDLIVSAMAMHHVADTDALLAAFAAHLAPGGRVALADLDTEAGTFHPEDTEGVYHHGFDRDAFAARLAAHGFEDVVIDTAVEVEKEGRPYTIFFATARKPA